MIMWLQRVLRRNPGHSQRAGEKSVVSSRHGRGLADTTEATMPSLVIRRFADRLTALADHTPDSVQLATAAGRLLEPVLDFDHVLEASEREPDPDHYRQHILHVDPARRFSIVALVWLPGHGTPVHDHLAWCVAGVLTGREFEHRFSLTDGTVLRDGGTTVNDAGDISILTKGPDIHQVHCVSDAPTISLHVYGTDITRRGSSINVTYDTVAQASLAGTFPQKYPSNPRQREALIRPVAR
jgi:predicted metal-dependent enzyme (double-stranded beta helix superfamily)